MAEPEEAAGGIGQALTRKLGPLPAWMYLVIAAGAWYYVQNKKKAAATAATTSTTGTTSTGNIGTDPAGNTGQIDPQTGYVYGTPEDTAALAQQSSSSSSSGTYSDNNAWGQAAINYLVGLGEDATVANSAISAYLGSQTLTSAQQAMVNSAIQALGAPPQPPTPTSTTPVVAPPGGATTYATNPPTGLTVASATANSIALKWNAAKNATGYTVTYRPGTSGSAQTVTTTTPQATLSGLAASTSYSVSVQATPADTGAAKATTTAKTNYGVINGGNPVATGSAIKPGDQLLIPANGTGTEVAKAHAISIGHLQEFNPGKQPDQNTSWLVPYNVQQGDTLQSIAAKFGIGPEHLAQILQSEGIS